MRASRSSPVETNAEDLSALLYEFQQEYRNVFCEKIGDYVFIYRALRRGEYNRIVTEDISELGKEELICQICTLWPKGIDFEDFEEAGVVSVLTGNILTNSFLDRLRSQENILLYYRNEMENVYAQIECIISEAFPQVNIEDITNWDIEQTMYYLSRAEWKLSRLRGVEQDPNGPFYLPPEEDPEEDEEEPDLPPAPSRQEPPEEKKSIRGTNKKEKLTPEKLAQLQRDYPEIDYSAVCTQIIPDNYDVTAPALRPI